MFVQHDLIYAQQFYQIVLFLMIFCVVSLAFLQYCEFY